ncbi:TRAM domain-containing protein [Thermococcus sp. 21S9]|uniref:TRAM domain-containing protein n=1 Tax=Thermococcus sp. 21S9 TaxID=1638223 RepID=UPI0014394C4D|nr:TRAM domain-containing protein [Thermococcus sp. 21S9]NJE54288.1 TRAM domain-containing protein [Thermococcus sp. 21S9]
MYGDRYGGYGRDYGSEAPVKVGERYKVKIESLGKGGDGIAKIQGFVIFVPNTQVGDEVEIVINSVKRKFAFASVIE